MQPNNSSIPTNPVGRFMVAVGGLVFAEQTGKLLIVRRADTLDWNPSAWEIVYGRIDQFEHPEEGLRRELHEEVGIKDLAIHGIIRVWHIYRGEKSAVNDLIGITYHCSTVQEEITLSAEHQDYAWVTPEEAVERITVPGIQADIQAYVDQIADQ